MRGLGQGTMVLKKAFIYSFSNSQRQRAIAHLPIAEGLSFRSFDRGIYNSKLQNEKKRFNPKRREFLLTSKLVA
jgi:hypothetical protein